MSAGDATITPVSPRPANASIQTMTDGAATFAIIQVTGSASYASGGDNCDLTSVSVANGVEPTAVFCQPSGGYIAEYDGAGMMLVYQEAGAEGAMEEAAGADLSGVTFNCLCFWA